MNRLFARLVAMFRRGPSRPVQVFRLPDGRIDEGALTTSIRAFWKHHREQAHYQLACVLATLRLAVPGLVNITWAYESDYDDSGYYQSIRDVELHVRLPDGREVTLALPDYGDLACEEFHYWPTRERIEGAIDEALQEGEDIDDEERARRFFQRLAIDHGLTGITGDEDLVKFGSSVASVIDFSRSIDTGYTAVPHEVRAMLPPLPPPTELPAGEGQGDVATAPEQAAPEVQAQAA